MKRATVTLPDRLAMDLEAWLDTQETPPTFTVVVQAALAEYLARRGAGWPARSLRITPAEKGSGFADVSLRDRRFGTDCYEPTAPRSRFWLLDEPRRPCLA